MNKKTASKWQKIIVKDRQQTNQSTKIQNFKTHPITESSAQILISKKNGQFSKNNQILMIQCAKESIIVQVTSNSFVEHNQSNNEDKGQISILKAILDLQGINIGPTGMLKGQIRVLSQAKISNYTLEIVEFLVKDTYFSRRDQYKVIKALKESVLHVYLRKTIYFDEIALEVNCLMKNNQTMVKSGIINKNTKLVFRTNCCKVSIGIELSSQTFLLNENKELYLQKMIEFIYIYLHRNNNFNNAHRLNLIIYGRCFYPQFKTLKDAYHFLLKENTNITSEEKNQINYSVALQKDYKGRIFQDVYRRIIWSSDIFDNFRQFFWQKISEFLFTINWSGKDNQNRIGKFITKSLQNKIHETTNHQQILSEIYSNKNDLKIKPFIHKIKCQLSESQYSNIFQTISLIGQQYRHHYKFRSLNQTGNNIIILTAGKSQYQTDQLSYKMAKSYCYLTNITCSLINFNKKLISPVKANIFFIQKKNIFTSENKKGFQNLIFNCIEKQVYNSPMNEGVEIRNYFQPKTFIYPEELIPMDDKHNKQLNQQHGCSFNPHYDLNQTIHLQQNRDYKIKYKEVSFITTYNMNDQCMYIHQQIYNNFTFYKLNNYKTKATNKMTELDIFDADLDKIIIKKRQWGIQKTKNNIAECLKGYQGSLQKKNSNTKYDINKEIDRVNRKLFKMYTEIKEDKIFVDHQCMSNDQYKFQEETPRKRKMSEIVEIENYQNSQGKVNIFQATFRNKNHQYHAGEKLINHFKKNATHNKQRRKNLYLDSNIHYFMPAFNENICKKFKAFIKKQYNEELKEEESKIIQIFQMEKMWKNLCFPMLTPIYTKHSQKFENPIEHRSGGVTDEYNDKKIDIFEDEICKLLMKNYQIEETSSQYHVDKYFVKLSKGQICCHLKSINGNLSKSFIVDQKRQEERIIPFMLYKYLCYEDKDCRFCGKYVYLCDKNYYDIKEKNQKEIKTVKIVLCLQYFQEQKQSHEAKALVSSSSSQNRFFSKKQKDFFQDFIKMFTDKHKEFQIELVKTKAKQIPKKKKFKLNFSHKEKRDLYHHEEVEIYINTQYNFSSLFEIVISWSLCSSVIVNEFVESIVTMGRRSNLKPFLVTSGNIFDSKWSISTYGQIIFQHTLSLQYLQNSILEKGEWLWDSNDYYFHHSGIAFINFKRDKKLILWRDNNNEKRYKQVKKDSVYKLYNNFFMKAATFDFIGGIISKVIDNIKMAEQK